MARRYTVGDSAGDIGAALSASMDADLVIVSGGLGPTRDDLTRAAVARLFRAPLREYPALLRALEARFRDRGYERLPELNRSQALVPEGGSVVTNRYGTAPGLAIEREGTLVVLLPGVPRELRGIFEDELETLLRTRFADRLVPVVHRFLHTAGVPESRLSELLEQVLPGDLDPLSIAFLPDRIGVDLRLTARGLPEAVAIERLDALEELVAPVIAPWRFRESQINM